MADRSAPAPTPLPSGRRIEYLYVPALERSVPVIVEGDPAPGPEAYAEADRRTRAGDTLALEEEGYVWELTSAGRALVSRPQTERELARSLADFSKRRRS